MHSTSVGEYEQARPVAALVRERFPDLVVLHTFFSPSGYEYARRLGEAAHVDYLPEDSRTDVRFALEALRPRALVFMKFDLWPNLVAEARRAAIPVLLLDATLRPRSWRSRWPAARLYRDVYAGLDVISAVSEADAARFRALVPGHRALSVDGDTRFDQVVRRRRAARKTDIASDLARSPRPFTLVAGSTWPADESRLLPAWREVAAGDSLRLVLVPHEPTPAHLGRLESEFARAAVPSRRYSEVEASGLGGARVVLVDRVGLLAELYAIGDAAYVGGAFSSGVHNLLEPAILGLPLLFGPRHENAPEAGVLLDAGGGTVVRSAVDLARRLEALRSDPQFREGAGARARGVVEANLGASERCLARLAPHLEPTPVRERTR
jgi:3-deoxy-D-manno-octulosonic-acid transferase